ncbi:MAG TPA: hypothetical protein G4O02_13455 [Caldilineae bacterium]|nr:hypothetical protein [Caldilineae bacterium]
MPARVTVREVWRLALPLEARLLAGRASLDREVSWACTMRPVPPAFPRLEGQELALINIEDLHHLDDLTLAQVIRSLHAANISAVVVIGPVEPEAVPIAEELAMPLFSLPAEAIASAIERDVIRLIVDREGALERYRSEIAHRLAEVLVANRGWRSLAEELAHATRKTVIIQDAMLRVLGQAAGPGPLLPLRAEDVEGLREPVVRPTGEGGVARLIYPIYVDDRTAGYLSLLGISGFDVTHRIVAREGALLCALELAKEQAIGGAEAQRRSEFLADLLRGDDLDMDLLARRARALHYDPTPPQGVLVVGVALGGDLDSDHLARQVQDELAQRRVAGLVAVRTAAAAPVTVLFPLPGEGPARAGRRFARDLIEAVSARFPQVALVGGLSRPLYELSRAKKAVEEAEQAWSLGRRLIAGCGSLLVDARELGVYQLLLPLEGSSTLRAFYEETLGALEEYDRRHGTELVRTLEVYFHQLGNLSRAAEVMYLHRNTLIYRLERIASILGIDLDDPETRLCLQLALKIRQIL